MKTVIVTGIGGVVGQGILRNLRAMNLDAFIIGTNIREVSAGNHLCDQVYRVPYATEDGYIPAMQDMIRRHSVSLIIPSTDYESYQLSLNQAALATKVAAAPAEVVAFCVDKYKNFEKFAEFDIPFARSALPSSYSGQFTKTVVKPREGRGSRNIHVSPPSPAAFTDDYVIQEYLDGPELTTTFYVRQDGNLHGFISLARELEQGNTARCEVTTHHDRAIAGLLERILAHFPFRGSCNIQSRVTDYGVIPFEINCRISGTNSVRSQFGFPDVEYTVDELLLDREPTPPAITMGSALRMMVDVIYPDIKLSAVSNRLDNFRIY